MSDATAAHAGPPHATPRDRPVQEFADVVLPHLDAAYRLARWLLSNDHDAEDAVQDASVRALRYFRTFSGGDGRAWFLRIVRNVCWDRWARVNTIRVEPFDEEHHTSRPPIFDPERRLMRIDEVIAIRSALQHLPARFRELLVLRELEGLSYRELADVIGIPIGTVMSGLSRARQALRTALDNELKRTGEDIQRVVSREDSGSGSSCVPM